MGKTYRKPRTTNKVRKSRAIERVTKKAQRELTYEEMIEFIDCVHRIEQEHGKV